MVNQAWMIAIAFLSGIGIPIMAALNAKLGARIGVQGAAIILFSVALLSAVTVAVISPGATFKGFTGTPRIFYLGGLFVAFYVLSITWIAPHIGVGSAIFLVLLGQMISAALIDNFGLLGPPVAAIDFRRGVGLILMMIGIFLARNPSL